MKYIDYILTLILDRLSTLVGQWIIQPLLLHGA